MNYNCSTSLNDKKITQVLFLLPELTKKNGDSVRFWLTVSVESEDTAEVVLNKFREEWGGWYEKNSTIDDIDFHDRVFFEINSTNKQFKKDQPFLSQLSDKPQRRHYIKVVSKKSSSLTLNFLGINGELHSSFHYEDYSVIKAELARQSFRIISEKMWELGFRVPSELKTALEDPENLCISSDEQEITDNKALYNLMKDSSELSIGYNKATQELVSNFIKECQDDNQALEEEGKLKEPIENFLAGLVDRVKAAETKNAAIKGECVTGLEFQKNMYLPNHRGNSLCAVKNAFNDLFKAYLASMRKGFKQGCRDTFCFWDSAAKFSNSRLSSEIKTIFDEYGIDVPTSIKKGEYKDFDIRMAPQVNWDDVMGKVLNNNPIENQI